MARVAIVGGHGKIARQLIPLLSNAGHTPLALVRNRDYEDELTGLGAEVGILDIENASEDDFAEAIRGSDAVVFAAGAGADGDVRRKQTVDLEGSLKSIAGAKSAGVSRFLQISAIGVDKPQPADAGNVWTVYAEAKRDADTALRESKLDWTIIRPGGLTDDEPTGRVEIDAEVDRGSIPRADVAALLVASLDNDRTIGKQWEAVSGSTPIAEAVATATS